MESNENDVTDRDRSAASSLQNRLEDILSQIRRVELDDPKGTIQRAWLIVVAFIVLICFAGIFESTSIRNDNGPGSLSLAALWSSAVHGILAVSGTFVIRRFTTHFALGFFLGLLIIVSQQDIILHSSFKQYSDIENLSGGVFAFLSMFMAFILISFASFLAIFRDVVLTTSSINSNVSATNDDDERRYHDGIYHDDSTGGG